MRSEHPTLALQHFLSGLAEYVFQTQLGVADPPLVDYVSDLICRFVRWDALFAVRDLAGRPVHEVVEMVAEAEHRTGDARRVVHRHIGDFTLFWVGLYPECAAETARSGQERLPGRLLCPRQASLFSGQHDRRRIPKTIRPPICCSG